MRASRGMVRLGDIKWKNMSKKLVKLFKLWIKSLLSWCFLDIFNELTCQQICWFFLRILIFKIWALSWIQICVTKLPLKFPSFLLKIQALNKRKNSQRHHLNSNLLPWIAVLKHWKLSSVSLELSDFNFLYRILSATTSYTM